MHVRVQCENVAVYLLCCTREMCFFLPLLLCFRDKPYLLFFDLRQCAAVVSISELIAGDVDTNTIFTCPTQQVSHTHDFVVLVYECQ